MPPAAQLLILLAIVLVFWFVVLRPARSQQRKMQQVQQEVAVGDEVVISAGIFGVVRSLDGAKVQLEIAPGTVVTVARQVVVKRADDLPESTTRGAGPAGSAEQPAGQSPDEAPERFSGQATEHSAGPSSDTSLDFPTDSDRRERESE